MLYILVVLIVVIQVFGLSNTLKFVSNLFNQRNANSPAHGDKLKQTLDRIFEKRSEELVGERLSELPASVSDIDDRGGLFDKKPARKLPPKRKNRGVEPRFVENTGRTSAEILAGRPDFGWRRVY